MSAETQVAPRQASVGALLFTTLVLLWVTSSFWFFRNVGLET